MREMKDSGIEWIGRIPKEWSIIPIKYVVAQNKDGIKIGPFGSALANNTIDDGEYNVYGQANLVRGDFSSAKNTINSAIFHCLSNYQVISGDICLSMMGTIGKCQQVPPGIHPGIMDSHLIKIRLLTTYEPRYFRYTYDKDLGGICYQQMQYIKTGSIMDGLNTSVVKRLLLVLPTYDKQKSIADYLDYRCSEIDSLSADIQKQIDILNQYKQSVITEAVTKGLDKNAEMKDSGVEWIGKIPEDWKIDKIKYHLFRNEVRNPGNQQVLSVYRDYGVIPKDSRDDNHNVTSDDTSKYKYVKPGYLVINKMKAWQGSMGISKYQGIVSPAYFVYAFRNNSIDKMYLHDVGVKSIR